MDILHYIELLFNKYKEKIFIEIIVGVLIWLLVILLVYVIYKKDSKELFKFSKERFTTPFLIGVIIIVFTIVFDIDQVKPYLPDFVSLFLVTVLGFIMFVMKDSFEIYKLKNRLEKADGVYKDLIDAHISLPNVYPSFLDDRISEENTQNGLVFINVQDTDYSKWLGICASNAKHTLFTTITGKYLPDFFFPSDGNKKYIDYLKKTNEFKIDNKTRIYIFPKKDFIDSLNKLPINKIKEFFENQTEFTIYFLDKEKFMREHLRSFADIHIAVNCDFALFDNALAFRRIDDLELAYYFTNREVKTLPCSFKKLFDKDILERDCFLKLDVNKVISKTIQKDCINEIINQIQYEEATVS